MKIKIDRVRYHRNGSGGAGFNLVEFRWRMQGERRERHFIGVVFEDPGCCAVLEPNNLLNRWQGDYFEPPLRVAIAAAHREDTSVFEYDGGDN